MQKWQNEYPSERVHTDSSFLRAWGSKCFSYNETKSGFDPAKNVGYPEQHARDLRTYTLCSITAPTALRTRLHVRSAHLRPMTNHRRPEANVSITFTAAMSVLPPSTLAKPTPRDSARMRHKGIQKLVL
jgi:hypothetical protein